MWWLTRSPHAVGGGVQLTDVQCITLLEQQIKDHSGKNQDGSGTAAGVPAPTGQQEGEGELTSGMPQAPRCRGRQRYRYALTETSTNWLPPYVSPTLHTGVLSDEPGGCTLRLQQLSTHQHQHQGCTIFTLSAPLHVNPTCWRFWSFNVEST